MEQRDRARRRISLRTIRLGKNRPIAMGVEPTSRRPLKVGCPPLVFAIGFVDESEYESLLRWLIHWAWPLYACVRTLVKVRILWARTHTRSASNRTLHVVEATTGAIARDRSQKSSAKQIFVRSCQGLIERR